MNIPFKTLLEINKDSSLPVYVQIANWISQNIQTGILKTGTKLLGTRSMADLLEVHRKMVIAAYDDFFVRLDWNFTTKGTFIPQNLPNVKPISFSKTHYKSVDNISLIIIPQNTIIKIPPINSKFRLAFNDDLLDVRSSPREELARLYAYYVKFGESAIFNVLILTNM